MKFRQTAIRAAIDKSREFVYGRDPRLLLTDIDRAGDVTEGMNAKRLLALYDRVADAPDAAPRLRHFVLDLAVRGRLVEQDPADEPASELLKRIAAYKEQLVEAGTIRRRRYLPNGEITEPPFVIPSAWRLVPLGDAIVLINGRAFKPTDWSQKGLPIVRIQNLNNPVAPFNRFDGEVKQKFLINDGDLLISWSGTPGTSFGAHIWNRGPAILNQHIFKSLFLKNALDKQFLKLAINARLLELIGQAHGGVGLQHITKPKLEALALTLPPLAEQHRIVAKVDELMALCDRLEAARTAREETRHRLTKASHARLSAPNADDEAFRADAHFVVEALPALTNRVEQVKQLRRSILDLAVRGKLVEQDPADEPASELLKRIAAEKERLVKAGNIKRSRTSIELDFDRLPFILPRVWAWTQIAELGVISPRNNFADDHVASFIPMPLIPAEWGTPAAHKTRSWGEIKKGYTHFAEGDVGLAKITPCFENGKSVVFRNLTGGIGSGTTELHVVRPIVVNADYILLFLKTPFFIETGILKMTGTAGQKRVPKEYFANSPFPLPPLAEQHRIVAKVDELMAFCDQLEAHLDAAGNGRQRLLESLLRDALHPGNETRTAQRE